MSLDVRTMYIAMGAICFIVAGALFVLRAPRFQRDGTVQWTFGWALQGAFWVLVGFRGLIGDFLSIVVAHTCLTGSYSLLYAAVRKFQGRSYLRGILLAPVAATLVFFWYFSAHVDKLSYRVLFISLLSAVQVVALVRALIYDAPAKERRSYWLTGFAFLAMALFWINRLVEGLTLPYGQLSVLHATTLRNASVIVIFATAVVSSIGFVFMVWQRADAARRASEDRYRSLFSEMTEGFALHEIICDEKGEPADYRFLEINPAFERLTGLARSGLLGKTVKEVMPETASYWIEIYGKVALSGESAHFEKFSSLIGKHYEVFAYRPAPRQCAALFKDVTERTLREARIAGITRLYAMLIRVNEAIVRTPDQGQLYAEVCRIIAEEGGFPLVWVGEVKDGQVAPAASSGPAAGYLAEIRVEVDGALGQGPTGTCVREDRPVIDDEFDRGAATLPWRDAASRRGFRTAAAFPLHCRGKVVAALTLYAVRPHDFDAEQLGLLQALAADISYALDTIDQEKLRSRVEQRLRLAQAYGGVGVWGLDVESGLLTWEPETEQLYGLPPGTMRTYEDWTARVHPEDLPRIQAERHAALEERRPFTLEYRIRHASGEERWMLGKGRGEYDESGRLLRVLGVNLDITEAKQAEEALRKAYDELEQRVRERTGQLERAYVDLMEQTKHRESAEAQLRQAQKMEALGTLSGGIAHDFNNILAAIIGFAELLGDSVETGSRGERHTKRIVDAALRGRELVKQLLFFSRKTKQEKKLLHLGNIVKETAKLLLATTPATIRIRTGIAHDSGLILGDPTQIEQVLMNLCTNAIHAMRASGGVLDISLSVVSVSPYGANPHALDPGSYVKLVVRDTGSGIPPDIIDKVFDPFFTTKKAGEGTGLGLSVVHGIVKHSKGSIFVESEPGRGSAFTVYFPEISGEQHAEAAEGEAIPTGSERILFIDDEESLVETGEGILVQLGYQVTSRTSSGEALSLLKENPSRFDLIITDVTMPGMTGIDLAREALALRADLPIIMCTGFSHLVDADAAKAAGIRAFAMKPLTKREIAQTIRRVLDG